MEDIFHVEDINPKLYGNERMRLAVVDVLLKHEANVNALDDEGCSTIMHEAARGYSAVCERLIQAPAGGGVAAPAGASCGALTKPGGARLSRCNGCRDAQLLYLPTVRWYCCGECQSADWPDGHRQVCPKNSKSRR